MIKYWSIISWVLSVIIFPVVGYIIGKAREKSKNQDADVRMLKDAVCALQRQSLYRSCEDYLLRGFCPIEIKGIINETYTSYAKLGGDGLITDLVRQLNSLPNINPYNIS